jgi:hypothetical protein
MRCLSYKRFSPPTGTVWDGPCPVPSKPEFRQANLNQKRMSNLSTLNHFYPNIVVRTSIRSRTLTRLVGPWLSSLLTIHRQDQLLKSKLDNRDTQLFTLCWSSPRVSWWQKTTTVANADWSWGASMTWNKFASGVVIWSLAGPRPASSNSRDSFILSELFFVLA